MQSDVKEIIKVYEDGSRNPVPHGVVIEFLGDNIQIDFFNVSNDALLRRTLGLIQAIDNMGLGEDFDKLIEYYSSKGSGADEGLQDNT